MQHDFVIDNGPGLAVRTDMQAAIQALASVSSGPIEPATMYANMLWFDTGVAPAIMRQRNQANTAWGLVSTGAVAEAPTDGIIYARQNGAWVPAASFVERFFTAGTTWSKTTGLRYLLARVQAGGGGGSGIQGTGTASTQSVGGGGGAGGYAERLFAAADLPASAIVTVGAGGAGNTGAAGGTGGNSAFGSLITCNGGGGGPFGAQSAAVLFSTLGGTGGTATGGTLNVQGAPGMGGVSLRSTATGFGVAGGFPGVGAQTKSGSGNFSWRFVVGGQDGANATGYGAGGSGAFNLQGDVTRPGGAGAPGFVHLMEIY
jgi:hypothetical protein